MSNKIKKNRQDNKREINEFMAILMCIAPYMCGLALGMYAFLIAAVLIIAIMIRANSEKMLRLYWNGSTCATLIILLTSIGTCFYGVSHGNSFIGVVWLLAIGAWIIYTSQLGEEEKVDALMVIPDAGAVMVVISAIMYSMPEAKHIAFSNSRMQGFMTYANTFALFLLIGLIIFALHDSYARRPLWNKFVCPLLLLVGILWSGSRITLVMTGVVMILLAVKKAEVRKTYLAYLIVGVVGAVVFALVSGNTASIGRLITFSQSSTLLGRFLYWIDAFKMMVNYPFGMGRMGYYMTNEAMQTGVYTVRFVHNDWLQVILDYGFVAFGAFVYLMVRQIRKSSGINRWILIIIGIHMIFDMDLQYMIIVAIMICAMNFSYGKSVELAPLAITRDKLIVNIAGGLMIVVFAWMALADACQQLAYFDVADAIYPWNVFTKEQLIVSSMDKGDVEATEKYCNETLDMNKYDAAAYDAMALVHYSNKDYLQMVEAKYEALLLQPYRIEEYDDFVTQAKEAITYFEENGDTQSADLCKEKLQEVPDILEAVKARTNPIAYKINDKPEFDLSKESLDYINDVLSDSSK